MEARLSNIVHHMTGEADEDTMSAWGSLEGGGSSPTDFSRKRNSFDPQMAPLGEGPFDDLDDNSRTGFSQLVGRVTAGETATLLGDEVGTGNGFQVESTTTTAVGRGTVKADKDASAGDIVGGETITAAEGIQRGDTTTVNAVVDGDNNKADETPVVGPRPPPIVVVPAVEQRVANDANDVEVSGGGTKSKEGDEVAQEKLGEVENRPEEPKTDEEVVEKVSSQADEVEAATKLSQQQTQPQPQQQQQQQQQFRPSTHSPRRSNQDDQTDGSNCEPHFAREDDKSFRSSSDVESIDQTKPAEEEEEGGSQVLGVPASITSGGSDARYVARQRWTWAFWRVCQLLRRKKRKQFEIMSQRATDR